MYILLLLVCWVACEELCFLTLASEDGGSIKVYYYETENDCKDHEDCGYLLKIHGGCNDSGDDEYLRASCTGENVEVWGCPDGDEDCSNCDDDDKELIEGGCKEDGGAYIRVEGCSDVDNRLMMAGGIMMGAGLFPCCLFALILCPLGFFLLLLGCCVMCCCQ